MVFQVDRSILQEAESACFAIANDPIAHLPDDLIHVIEVGKSAVIFGKYILQFLDKMDDGMVVAVKALLRQNNNTAEHQASSISSTVGIVFDNDSDVD